MRKLLFLTHSAGFVHDYLPFAERTLTELGRESKLFDVDVFKDCLKVRWSSIGEDYDVIVFATTGELPMSQEDRRALIEAVASGTGFVGVHNAADTFYEFSDYGRMVGGYFAGHPWTQEVLVRVEDPSHPSTKHLQHTFKVKEEVYTFKDWSRERTHVLVSLVNDSVDLSKGTRPDQDYALCWCHEFGEGRVFYTAFGHFPELWSEKWFRFHLLGGISWAMRLD
jgi:type 1 glutamine amidotransferase